MGRLKTILLSVYIWAMVSTVLLFWFPITLLLFLFTSPFDPGRRLLHHWGLLYGRTIRRLNPLWTISVEGLSRVPEGQPFVYVANHESHADSIALGELRRQFKWVMKASLARIPVFGWQTQLAGYIAVERGNRESARGAMQQAARWLSRGIGVFFFAEGTRSQTGEIGRFKEGAFRLALETHTPIVPIAIAGTKDALPKHSLLFTSRAKIRVWIGEPIPVEGEATPENITALTERVRALVVAEKARLEAEA